MKKYEFVKKKLFFFLLLLLHSFCLCVLLYDHDRHGVLLDGD